MIDLGRLEWIGAGLVRPECALSPDGRRFFVNETFARRTDAFAGEALRRCVLGRLLGDRLAVFDAPAGLEPAHWRADLGPLARHLNEGEG